MKTYNLELTQPQLGLLISTLSNRHSALVTEFEYYKATPDKALKIFEDGLLVQQIKTNAQQLVENTYRTGETL